MASILASVNLSVIKSTPKASLSRICNHTVAPRSVRGFSNSSYISGGSPFFASKHSLSLIISPPSLKSCNATFGPRKLSISASSEGSDLTQLIKEKNSQNPVMVYSKSYCPFCSQVKSLFKKLSVNAKVVELNEIADGDDIQDALYDLTNQRTVPNIFIGGKHIGGCDDTMELHSKGKLVPLLKEAGVNI